MKESYWAYFIIILGISIITIMMLVQRMTTTTEEDYYLGREVLESSMIDAIDYGTYRTTGKVIMSEQKFIEVFVRRFAASVANNKTYELSFYDIYEDPPKATVKIRTSSGSTALGSESFDIKLDTTLSGIVETIYGVSDKIDNPVPPSSSSSSSSSTKPSSSSTKRSSSSTRPPSSSSSKKSSSSSSSSVQSVSNCRCQGPPNTKVYCKWKGEIRFFTYDQYGTLCGGPNCCQ